MPKSKCIKCEYKNSFDTNYGTLYSFNVEMEDGTTGLYNSKDKDNPKFKVGEEIEYETEEKSGVKNGKEWSFTKLKPASKGGFSKETPEDRKKRASRTALFSALSYARNSENVTAEDQVVKLHDYFFSWLIEDIDDGDKSKDRATALMNTIDMMGSPIYEINTTKDVKETANKLLNLIWKI